MNRPHKPQNKTSVPKGDFTRHKAELKEAIMQDFQHRSETSWAKIPWFKQTAFKLGSSFAAIAVVTVFAVAIAANPITASKVLAEAQQASQQANEQGRYYYSKSRITETFNGNTSTQTSELWEDTETGDHRVRLMDEGGDVVSEFATVGDEFYSTPFDQLAGGAIALNDIESGELEALPGGVAVESFELDLDDIENLPVIDGESATSFMIDGEFDIAELEGLDDEEFQRMIESGELIIGGGPVEIVELDEGELNIAVPYGDDALFDAEATGVIVEAVELGGFSTASGALISNSNQSDRKELFNELLQEEGANLSETSSWEGRSVVGVTHSEYADFSSTMYFDANSYEYVGSEFNAPDGFSFKEVILEQSYSNNAFDLSTEGLEKLDNVFFDEILISEE